jgi:hypothetical protein
LTTAAQERGSGLNAQVHWAKKGVRNPATVVDKLLVSG